MPLPFAPRAAALAAGLLMATTAQAQTYTATLLNRPSGADSCYETQPRFSLGPNGDVSSTCSTRQITLSSLLAGLSGQSGATWSYRAVVWRGGSATPKALNGTFTQPYTSAQGMQADGSVLGYTYNSKSQQTLSIWRGTTRSTYALPSGYSGWYLDGVSRDGLTLLISQNDLSRFKRSFALVKDGAATRLPSPPTACGALGTTGDSYRWTLNNVGQVALLRVRTVVDATYGTTGHPGTICLYQNGGWTVSDPTPSYVDPVYNDTDFYDLSLLGLSDTGEVLLSQVVHLTWQAGVGFQLTDRRAGGYGAGSDVVGGGTAPGQTTPAAVLWRNGQELNLNLLATAPAGYTFVSALATNARGQVLVLAQPTSATFLSPDTARLVLLTPR